MLMATACEAPRGSIELENNSDTHILWLVTGRDFVDQNLRASASWVTTAPGRVVVKAKRQEAFGPEWCDPPHISHVILRPIDGQPLDGSPKQVGASDFEVVAERGPGFCWGDQDSTWIYRGP